VEYALLLANGTVVDPAQGIHRELDVALDGGRVVAIDERLPHEEAGQVIDVSDRIVTPGLIDLHTHLYKGVSALGIDADQSCLPNGVTTAVDAGTAGAITFPGFRDYCVATARTRIYAYVNLSSIGLILDDGRELDDMRYVDPDAVVETIVSNRPLCLGIKIRIGSQMVSGLGFRPLEAALDAASRADCGLMVHITNPGLPLDEVFDRLRPGDVITHTLHGRGQTVVEGGRVLPALRRAEERGVITDVGHGAGSFAFATAQAALADGFRPFTISTDLHAYSIMGPVYDLPTTMSKFLALGMSLDEVVAATTVNAARAIRRDDEIGSLRVGMCGDVAVFDLVADRSTFEDCQGMTISGSRRLVPILTVRDGEVAAVRTHDTRPLATPNALAARSGGPAGMLPPS